MNDILKAISKCDDTYDGISAALAEARESVDTKTLLKVDKKHLGNYVSDEMITSQVMVIYHLVGYIQYLESKVK